MSRRRIPLFLVLAAVATASLAVRLPGTVQAVGRALPASNMALAAETATPAAPAPTAPTSATPAAAPAAAEGGAPPPTATPAAGIGAPAFDPNTLTAGELDVLQNLSKRREEIEARARELDSREALVAAAEARVDKKLAEIKEIEARIQAANAAQSAEDDAQMARLVKVYETMKPADAANIFNSLDFSVLIEVASRMKEAKIAPVLAAMDPEAAKKLTVALATRKAVAPVSGNSGG